MTRRLSRVPVIRRLPRVPGYRRLTRVPGIRRLPRVPVIKRLLRVPGFWRPIGDYLGYQGSEDLPEPHGPGKGLIYRTVLEE